jgi:hypothetical protein
LHTSFFQKYWCGGILATRNLQAERSRSAAPGLTRGLLAECHSALENQCWGITQQEILETFAMIAIIKILWHLSAGGKNDKICLFLWIFMSPLKKIWVAFFQSARVKNDKICLVSLDFYGCFGKHATFFY